MIDADDELSVRRQAELLEISHANVYYWNTDLLEKEQEKEE